MVGVTYRFAFSPLDGAGAINAAYLTGFDEQQQHSITEQLFVAR
jgi:hypothetical protein